jgi:hypothetical protein
MKEDYNSISTQRKQEFVKNSFDQKGFVQKKFNSENINLQENFYTTQLRKYFDKAIKKRLNIDFDELENIHKNVDEELTAYDFDYGINGLTRALYDMDDEFISIYHNFIKDWVDKNLADGKKFWFQKTPTIRVHCPGANSKTVYPAYHNDTFLGHHPYETNIWIPLTHKRQEGHGFTLLSFTDSKEILKKYDFDVFKYYEEVRKFDNEAFKITNAKAKNATTDFNEILLFDVKLLHSTMPMCQQTRVSMDVRIIFDKDIFNRIRIEKDFLLFVGPSL